MRDFVTKWTRDYRTIDDVCELLMVEQFQIVVNGELCIQLKERCKNNSGGSRTQQITLSLLDALTHITVARPLVFVAVGSAT